MHPNSPRLQYLVGKFRRPYTFITSGRFVAVLSVYCRIVELNTELGVCIIGIQLPGDLILVQESLFPVSEEGDECSRYARVSLWFRTGS